MLRNILFTELEQLLLKLGFTSLPTAGSYYVFSASSIRSIDYSSWL